jgi:glutamate synthase domain-containing protein 2
MIGILMDFVWGRYSVLVFSAVGSVILMPIVIVVPFLSPALIITMLLTALGIFDFFQKSSLLRANFPIVGHMRYFFESFRPELRQYFWEDDKDELPYSRNQRSMVYQRAKSIIAARPLGSIENMYEEDFTWLNHSLSPIHPDKDEFYIKVGEGDKTYQMSLLNISGTSFGSLSPSAIHSLNAGAALGNFAHNTGEGSLSKHHQAGGGDIVWQVSTGYFGCRASNGCLDRALFEEKAQLNQVKMIEIKLSQGAKPGHGGMLLGSKVTSEIALTRGIKIGEDCISPAVHPEFSTPDELLTFALELKGLSGGKPIGIKLCIGHPWEFIAIVKAMVKRQQYLDFITVDGAEGGTGAAPVEFTDHVGSPLKDALVFVDNVLIGAGLRDRIKVAASGKVVSAYDIVQHCALGADWINMARPFMFSLGCIQARDCASGKCPTGIATMDPQRYRVLDIPKKAIQVRNFHHNTLVAVSELIGASGVAHPKFLTRRHIVRRLSGSEIRLVDQIYPKVEPGALLRGETVSDQRIDAYWNLVDGTSFNFQN